MASQAIFAQEYESISTINNYPINIDLDASQDAVSGIPAQSKLTHLEIPSHTLDTSFVCSARDGSHLLIEKQLDTITFVFSKQTLKTEGKFYIPSRRQTAYAVLLDSETFDDVVKFTEFYVPIRIGTWSYYFDNKKYTKYYNIKHDTTSQNSCNYHKLKDTTGIT